jgi:hypothetical protein
VKKFLIGLIFILVFLIVNSSVDLPEGSFFVSDSYSISLPDNVSYAPGIFNQTISYEPGDIIDIYFVRGAFELAILNYQGATSPYSGINVDVKIGLYNCTSGNAVWCGTSYIAKFIEPYGTATNGIVMNSTARIGLTPTGQTFLSDEFPLKLTITCPDTPGQIYKIGAYIVFHNGVKNVHGHYRYFMQGWSEKRITE